MLNTRTTASFAARVSISTHETVEGQAFSTSAFILSMTSYPLTEFLLGKAFFSPLKSFVSSRSKEPSQPCAKKVEQSYKISKATKRTLIEVDYLKEEQTSLLVRISQSSYKVVKENNRGRLSNYKYGERKC